MGSNLSSISLPREVTQEVGRRTTNPSASITKAINQLPQHMAMADGQKGAKSPSL